MNFWKKAKLITVFSLLTAFLLTVPGFAAGACAAGPVFPEKRTDTVGSVSPEKRTDAAGPVSPEKRTDADGQMAAEEDAGKTEEVMSVVYESAEILYYDDGTPYVHDVLTNHTDKRIVETEYCMLAYDEKGSPLKLRWNFLDSSAESSFENPVRSRTDLLPGQTEEYHGGWSLYAGGQTENMPKTKEGEVSQAAYVLQCLKQVVFEDGTVWNNPDYENWLETYAGKETKTDELQNYYPYQYIME